MTLDQLIARIDAVTLDEVAALAAEFFDPDRQVLLATPVDVAAERARGRASSDTERALDRFEADAELQRRTGQMYRQLAAQDYLSPWTVLTPAADGSVTLPTDLAD